MTRRSSAPHPQVDPFPYTGPIRRADGEAPFNHYLWPLHGDDFWVTHDLDNRLPGQHHFDAVALADGRYATTGSVVCIERGTDVLGRPCVFPDRRSALHTSAARMIRAARQARHWKEGPYPLPGALTEEDAAEIIGWARNTVARETKASAPRQIALHPIAVPPRRTGLPLFDVGVAP